MAARQVQISALISDETLLHALHALRELPRDVIIPSRIVLTEASAREVVDALAAPRAPTPAMEALMRGEDGEDVPG